MQLYCREEFCEHLLRLDRRPRRLLRRNRLLSSLLCLLDPLLLLVELPPRIRAPRPAPLEGDLLGRGLLQLQTFELHVTHRARNGLRVLVVLDGTLQRLEFLAHTGGAHVGVENRANDGARHVGALKLLDIEHPYVRGNASEAA